MARSYSELSQDDPRAMRYARDLEIWKADQKRRAERAYAKALARGAKREGAIFRHAAEEVIENDNPAFWDAIGRLKHIPVTIHEFINSKEFLGDQIEIWPALQDDLRDMNPDVLTGAAPVHEALLGGATGTGKSALSDTTNKYQAYLATCFKDPQRLFNLTKVTPIVFMFMSVSTTVTRRVLFSPFRESFLAMPYTQKWLAWNKQKESSLELAGNIVITPAIATEQAILGQAIAGGILDEVNFMTVVENSKQVPGPAGQGGRYDQAEIIYRAVSRRRKRSFLTQGPSFGTICVVSSTRYKGDFLDRRIDEVRTYQEEHTVTKRRKQYEVAPPGRYKGPTFRMLIGTDSYPSRVLEDWEQEGVHYPERAQIENVPIELRVDFLRDPEKAVRDYCGIASNALSPFYGQRHKIIEAYLRGQQIGLKQYVEKPDVILATDGMPQIVEENLPPVEDRAQPRFVHIDLSGTKDRCGIAMSRIDGMVPVLNPTQPDMVEILPDVVVELAVSIQPDPAHPIDPADIRQWVMQLINYWHFNIVQVSYDGYQSVESKMLFRKAGVRTADISLDRTEEPHMVLRRAIYDERCVLPPDADILRGELVQLEHHEEARKIDHPPKGSKDVADAVAGSVFAATRAPEIRTAMTTLNTHGRVIQTSNSGARRQGTERAAGPIRRR